MAQLCELAEQFDALLFVDEVHAVGLYGREGAGVAARDNVEDGIDIIQGTLGKAFGMVGGYIAADAQIVDYVRSFGSAFIFTTSLPPAVTAGAIASIEKVRKADDRRAKLFELVGVTRDAFARRGIPIIGAGTHITPVPVSGASVAEMWPRGFGTNMASMCSRLTTRPSHAAQNDCASPARLTIGRHLWNHWPMRSPRFFTRCRSGWRAEALKLAAITIVISMTGCAAAPLAALSTAFGIAGTAVSTGSSVYSSGKLDSAENASLDELRAAVFLAADDLRLETVYEKDIDATRHIRFIDARQLRIDVTIDPRTDKLCRLRINVGINGNEPTARLILARVRAHLSPVPSLGTPGEG